MTPEQLTERLHQATRNVTRETTPYSGEPAAYRALGIALSGPNLKEKPFMVACLQALSKARVSPASAAVWWKRVEAANRGAALTSLAEAYAVTSKYAQNVADEIELIEQLIRMLHSGWTIPQIKALVGSTDVHPNQSTAFQPLWLGTNPEHVIKAINLGLSYFEFLAVKNEPDWELAAVAFENGLKRT